MKKFIKEKFKKGKIAVHCDTEEKANEFLKACKEAGLTWSAGDDLESTNNFEEYMNETSYECSWCGVRFSPKDFFEECRYEVISFDELIEPNKETPKLEDIFKNIELEGNYLEAFKELIKTNELDKEESEMLETVIGIVQLIVKVERLPLQIEVANLNAELKQLKEESTRLKTKANALEEANKNLTLENTGLLNSVKALKDISVVSDKFTAIEEDLKF